jgi:aspartate aminotransferase-like enzyme
MRRVLFIPGPSEVEYDVLLELSKPVVAHYGKEWAEFYNRVCDVAKKIFRTEGFVTLLPVPGIVAVEMAVFNVVEEGDKVVNLSNGLFSELIGRILRLHGANVYEVSSEWGSPLDLDRLREVLDENPDVKAVFMVQNETSTGVLNDVASVAKIVRKHDKILCVDAISSYGGVEFDFDSWGVDYAVGYASKCLSGVNGVCPVAVSDRFLERVRRRKSPIRSYYFNLPVYMEMSKFFENHPHPTSMPTSVIRAFYYVASKALEEGLENRYRRHRRVAKACRAAIKAMNLTLLPKEEYASPTVTALFIQEGLDKKIISKLSEEHGIVISGGLGKLKGKSLRIGHMGTTANPQYILQLVQALEITLKELGMVEKVGKGTEAAHEALEKD